MHASLWKLPQVTSHLQVLLRDMSCGGWMILSTSSNMEVIKFRQLVYVYIWWGCPSGGPPPKPIGSSCDQLALLYIFDMKAKFSSININTPAINLDFKGTPSSSVCLSSSGQIQLSTTPYFHQSPLMELQEIPSIRPSTLIGFKEIGIKGYI